MSAIKKLDTNGTSTVVEAIPPEHKKWNKKILIVDDEPELRSIYTEILKPSEAPQSIQSSRSSNVIPINPEMERYHFDVYQAGSAGEALNITNELKATGHSFAMGFFDVRLGEGMDGIELVKEIHQVFPDMYAVFVTAYNDRTIDSITTVLGANRIDRWDYMNKPFNQSEIIQKARNFVALWNLQRDKLSHEEVMADLNRKVLESERVTSVAAVARGVAHEFGNLLMQIMGKAEVSRNRTAEQMNDALNKIIDASQRAHEILDRFNHLSDTKSHTSRKQKTLIDQLIHESVELLSHQFKKSGVKVCFLKSDRFYAEVHATSLLQVMVNLFINALHAMKSIGQIDVSIIDDGDDFEIRVRDYGPGIKPELIDRVMEPFFTTKGDKGTGLGLAISREIIEIDHGGEFKLRNHPSSGLEISMRIPKKQSVA